MLCGSVSFDVVVWMNRERYHHWSLCDGCGKYSGVRE
jgi:hypothetical protein